MEPWREELYHHGIPGQKWYVRRYQNEDGTLTELGRKRLEKGRQRNEKLFDRRGNLSKYGKLKVNEYSSKIKNSDLAKEAIKLNSIIEDTYDAVYFNKTDGAYGKSTKGLLAKQLDVIKKYKNKASDDYSERVEPELKRKCKQMLELDDRALEDYVWDEVQTYTINNGLDQARKKRGSFTFEKFWNAVEDSDEIAEGHLTEKEAQSNANERAVLIAQGNEHLKQLAKEADDYLKGKR